MQDIVPKGRTIREIQVKREEIKPKTKNTKPKTEEEPIKAKKEYIIDREESETVVEVPPEEAARRESIRQAREEFEARQAKRAKRARRPGRGFFSGAWNNNRGAVIAALSIVAVLALAAVATGSFRSALVTVTPRVQAFTADADLTAKRSAGPDELPFSVSTIKLSGSQTVRATGQKQVSTRAQGTIVIYNNYSSAAQRLIKNTRFATPEGLIFRVSDSVTVPGKNGATPGSVEAVVMADEPGASYNVGLKDFTIPGFKGDPRYAAFYARSKTPLAGGFVGTQKIVAEADRAKAKADIESKLRDELLRQVAASVPEGSIFYPNAYSIDFQAQPDEATSATEATIKEDGTISAIVFDRRRLAAALARQYAKDYKGEAVSVPLLPSLVYSAKDQKAGGADSLAFHLSGNAAFEWVYDEAALKEALKGHTRAETPAILRKFPMIEKADISLRPFWSGSFPGRADRIAVQKHI